MTDMPEQEYWPNKLRIYKSGRRFYFISGAKDNEKEMLYHHDDIVKAKDARIAELEQQLKGR